MLKRVWNFIQKDLTNALRDNMALYIILFPVLLAIGMRLFLPSVQSMKLTIAVDAAAEQQVIDRLRNYAIVELYDTPEEVRSRVERPDDLAGIIKDGEEYVVLLEGNETGEAKELTSMLMNVVLSEEPAAQYEHVSMGKNSSMMKETAASLLLLTAVLIGGLIIGLNIVNEKETKALRALAVSPLRMVELIISHTLLSLISAVILALLSSFILMGTEVDYGRIILSIAASAGVAIIMGYLIGGLADNIISAIAVMKVLFILVLGIPLGSLFVPQSLQWVFYPFPHYWAFQSYQSIFNASYQGVDFPGACMLSLGLSVVILMGMFPLLKNNLKLR